MLETDPRDLLLDADNDLVVTDDLQFSYGLTGVTQECRIALQMFEDEWFLDLDAGEPYWNKILGFKRDQAIEAARVSFTDTLLAVEDVTGILKLNITFDPSTRGMDIDWRVRCTFGDTDTDTIAVATGME
jgi:hypothetical protein